MFASKLVPILSFTDCFLQLVKCLAVWRHRGVCVLRLYVHSTNLSHTFPVFSFLSDIVNIRIAVTLFMTRTTLWIFCSCRARLLLCENSLLQYWQANGLTQSCVCGFTFVTTEVTRSYKSFVTMRPFKWLFTFTGMNTHMHCQFPLAGNYHHTHHTIMWLFSGAIMPVTVFVHVKCETSFFFEPDTTVSTCKQLFSSVRFFMSDQIMFASHHFIIVGLSAKFCFMTTEVTRSCKPLQTVIRVRTDRPTDNRTRPLFAFSRNDCLSISWTITLTYVTFIYRPSMSALLCSTAAWSGDKENIINLSCKWSLSHT